MEVSGGRTVEGFPGGLHLDIKLQCAWGANGGRHVARLIVKRMFVPGLWHNEFRRYPKICIEFLRFWVPVSRQTGYWQAGLAMFISRVRCFQDVHGCMPVHARFRWKTLPLTTSSKTFALTARSVTSIFAGVCSSWMQVNVAQYIVP